MLIVAVIVAFILIVIIYYRKKRHSKVELPKPIHDDPDSPCYTYNPEKKVLSNAISTKEQHEMKQSFAYDVLQSKELPSTGVQAEDQF